MEIEIEETEEELETSHKKLDEFVNKNISKDNHIRFYELLMDVINWEIEMEKFCNQ